MLCLARVCCDLLWHCPLPCTAWCAKPDPDPNSLGRCGLAGCRLQSGALCVSRAIRIQIARPIRRARPQPEGMRTLPQAPPGTRQPPNTCAVLPHLVAAPPEPGNRNQNQGPSRPRAGPSLVVYILQAASVTAVDVNRAPRPAGGASGRGAPQSTTGPTPGPRTPSRLKDLAQCAAQIGFKAETAAFAEGNFNIMMMLCTSCDAHDDDMHNVRCTRWCLAYRRMHTMMKCISYDAHDDDMRIVHAHRPCTR